MGLLDIPIEMFERIAECCDPEDLLTLRSVCRHAAAAVLKTYAKTWFHERTYSMIESHLRQAVKTANQPSLCKPLDEMYFCVEEVGVNDSRPRQQADSAASRTVAPSIPDVIKARQVQEDMREKEVDLHLLAPDNIFAAPGAMPQQPGSEISRRHDFGKLPRACTWRLPTFHASHTGSGPEWITYKGILQCDVDIPLRNIVFNDVANDNMKLALSKVKFLTLTTSTDQGDEEAETIGKRFGEALSAMPLLERLDLIHSHRYGEVEAAFSRGLFIATMPTLEDLTLQYCDVQYDNLVEFLARHSASKELRRFVGVNLGVKDWANTRIECDVSEKLAEDLKLATKIAEVECYWED